MSTNTSVKIMNSKKAGKKKSLNPSLPLVARQRHLKLGKPTPLNKRAQLWNSAEVFVLVLSGAVLAIEKDGKSLAN